MLIRNNKKYYNFIINYHNYINQIFVFGTLSIIINNDDNDIS